MLKNIKLTLVQFSWIITAICVLLYNIPFLQFVYTHAEQEPLPKTWLILSLFVILVGVTFMMTYLTLFLLGRVGRWLIAILQILNALSVYFIITYHVVLDDAMMGNVFNTRYSEASGFFSWWLVGFVVLFGILPSAFVLLYPVEKKKRNFKKLGKICGSTLGIALLLILTNISQTLWIGQYDTELGGTVMPWSYLVNTVRMFSLKHDNNVEETKLPDATITDKKKTAVILVIGESARKANFQLYGYGRATNPLLSKQQGLKVIEAQSCATYTTAGVRAILEPEKSSTLYEILPNYAFRTGVDVQWRSNNWGQPPVHIDDYLSLQDLQKAYPEFNNTIYDEILFHNLRQRIEQSDKDKVLIVLHTSTSHGPDYTAKYPKKFEYFKPVIDNVEQAQKDLTKLKNAYDNSIIYTDYLLSTTIDSLRTLTDWQTALVYVSDHGESLGENNLFMHGVPMSMAPAYQYEIPFLVWLSPGFREYKEFGKDIPVPLEQHYVFHSVLNLLSIKSPAYKPEFDMFKQTK